MSRARPVIALFAKPPVGGRAKTRLARTVGDDAAVAFARAFLVDSLRGLQRLGWADVVIATPEPDGAFPDAVGETPRWDHGGGDLGRRMARVLRRALDAGAPYAIAVGADAPGAPQACFDGARAALEGGADAVLGATPDGGYYLIGMRRCDEDAFDGVPWSCSDTLRVTAERLTARGLRVAYTAPWRDIDEDADLNWLATMIAQGRARAPQTAALLVDRPVQRPGVSVIVPTLNEVARIGAQVAALRADPGLHEVIVVDAASDDGTAAVARAAGATVVTASRGRAAQMNAGARIALGDTVLFLHADVRLPPGAGGLVANALADDRVVAGAFKTWHVADGGANLLGPLLHLADVRSRYTRLPYGDQAIFARRAVFEAVGGYPDQPLMEDLELSRRLSRQGRIARVDARVEVSGRRFLARPVFYTLAVNVFPLLYAAGVPPETLLSAYRNVR